jgi:hypothetical protein
MIFLNLDLTFLFDLNKNLKPAIEEAMAYGAQQLTMQTHGHIVELAQKELHSTREIYTDALSQRKIDDNTWIIALHRSAMFIEEGLPQHEMIDDLLGDNPKGAATEADGTPAPKKITHEKMGTGSVHTSKADGSRWRAIPFEHKKGPTQQTPEQTTLTKAIKKQMGADKALKARGISYGKLEMGSDGRPKLGTLHEFNIMNKPLRTSATGPGQGWGEVGQVKQGPTGIPFLQGVRVSQHRAKDKQGKAFVQRSVSTFRIVSSKHKGTGRWMHPGLDAKKFFEKAYEWAENEWNTKMRDQILERILSKL